MLKKIFLLFLIMCLCCGLAVAADTSKLKTPSDYGDIQGGCATYKTYSDRIFFVEKLYTPSVYFENDTKYVVSLVDGNIYYFEDTAVDQYGYSEAVELDGEQYAISVFQMSKLSPGEKKVLLEDLKEFNKLNNLTPIAV